MRSISCAVFGGSATEFLVYVGATYICDVTVTGHDSRTLDVRHAVYAGEAIGCATTTSAGHLVVSGYLFDDTPGAKALPWAHAAGPELEVHEATAA